MTDTARPDASPTAAGTGSAAASPSLRAPAPDTDVRAALFSDQEYASRLAKVRERMRFQGLQALIVTDPANIFYLTGYDAWSFYTPQMLFVGPDGDPLLFMREMDANGAWRTACIDRELIIGYPERYVHRPHIHPFDWVAFRLRQLGWVARTHGVVGLEMDSHFFSPKAYRALVNAVPEWTLVESFELVNWVRAVKSDAEIQYMRHAARVATGAMQAAVDAIEPGAPQNEIAAAIAHAQALGAGESFGDYPAIMPLLPTGASADTPHLTWSNRVLQDGEAVVVEIAGAHRRYHVPIARTISLGEPGDDLKRLEEAVAEGLQAVLDAAAPGVPVRELALAWNWKLAQYGLAKESRLGYSIGIGYPPDWGERTMSIRSEDESILERNMTFHIICGMWMEGHGYEVSESVRISDTGVEAFTAFPRRIIRK
ncbi:M24 family metallopeptidase [Brevibacterium sp. 5221]|uniref:M24 family metallopeptidase n=1 Tax=Brevibacterium rongguiense TaxID=2695267 RepID=A0A6N9H3D4_9MICO|nr:MULTISPECIES: M24 family metallopeptidase [Brevibacterium]MYM18557.1 M24 family metallopeptidase [Brevibacterium rongguiense]WAL39628.1 M24 family metallopeptidase [Brevibacterium sp. BRM-1]